MNTDSKIVKILLIVINSVVAISVVGKSVTVEVFVDIANVVVVLLAIKDRTRAAAMAIPRIRVANRDKITCRHEQLEQYCTRHLYQIFVDV